MTPRRVLLVLLALGPVVAVAPQTHATPAAASTGTPTVIESRTIGHTVKGRAIRAYRVGDPKSTNKVLVMSTMHGDEQGTRWIVRSIRDGKPVHGIDLWLLPTLNRDGLARDTRKNAHGVDLNRNFPYHWVNLNGRYESGRHAASEPETRALMRFIGRIRPQRIVSFHQPLHGVDVSTPRSRRFARRLASGLHLPRDVHAVVHAHLLRPCRHRGVRRPPDEAPHEGHRAAPAAAPARRIALSVLSPGERCHRRTATHSSSAGHRVAQSFDTIS
jgi:protein MpaA